MHMMSILIFHHFVCHLERIDPSASASHTDSENVDMPYAASHYNMDYNIDYSILLYYNYSINYNTDYPGQPSQPAVRLSLQMKRASGSGRCRM